MPAFPPLVQDEFGLTLPTTSDALDLDLASSHFPGGTLFAALYDRELMRLSDRGGASGMIGARWADLCADALDLVAVPIMPLQPGLDELRVDRVIRLDDIPAIASQASQLKLQNPDFLLIHEEDGVQHVRAADAKFSIDTAKSRQVSAGVVTALIAMGPAIGRLVPSLRPDAAVDDGVFLCPDYSLTRRLLQTRRGIRRVTVFDDEVRLLPVDVARFLKGLDHERMISSLSSRDALPLDPFRSLALALYYLRAARALIGCWIDHASPLLLYKDRPEIDLAEIEDAISQDAPVKLDTWKLVLSWNDRAEETRRQRTAVDHVTSLPISGKELRGRIDVAATAAGVDPPSTNRVRRILGAWYRERHREAFGPIFPPIDDLDGVLSQLAQFGRSLRPALEVRTDETILDLVSAPDACGSREDAAAVVAG